MSATTIDQAALDEVLHGLRGPVMREAYVQAETLRELAKERIKRSDREGVHLEDTGIVEDTLVAGWPGFLVSFEAPYVGPYYFGAGPHEIRPRNARVLAFKWPKMGPGIFHFARVRHPGSAAHPFLHEAVLEMYGAHLP